METDEAGICPNCEARAGKVGSPCPEPGCARKGYAYIPHSQLVAAREMAAQRSRPFDTLLGRSLDRYFLVGKLGEGGMGAVYLALQRPLDREVALKVISGLDMAQAAVARFEREARAISVLDHPNIVKLHDYGVAELDFRIPYMAIEYVRNGKTLQRALAQIQAETPGGVVPTPVVASIFEQILNALGTAHDLGIIHRDMKPDNVMVVPVRGHPHHVKILDFGLAKAITEVSGFDGNVSRADQFLGTPCYMAPEQTPGQRPGRVDGRADLYALAVMLFEIFSGVRPHDGNTPLEVLIRKIDPSFQPLDLPAAASLSAPLRGFLAKGMSADPAGRFATAAEMLDAFRAVVGGGETLPPVRAQSVVTPEPQAVAVPPIPLASTELTDASWAGAVRSVPVGTVSTPMPSSTDGATGTRHRGRLLAIAALVLLGAVVAGVAAIWSAAGTDRPAGVEAAGETPDAAVTVRDVPAGGGADGSPDVPVDPGHAVAPDLPAAAVQDLTPPTPEAVEPTPDRDRPKVPGPRKKVRKASDGYDLIIPAP